MSHNELLVVSDEMSVTFESLKDDGLRQAALKFCELGKKSLQTIYEQYKVLESIDNQKLYLKDFNSFEVCAETLFGIGKAQARRMVQVSRTFLHGENAERFKEFTPSALVEMLPKGDEKEEVTQHKRNLIGLMDNAVITPDDTKVDVREKVNEELRGKKTADKATKPEVVKPKKGEKVAKLLGDLEAYAKRKKDKQLTDIVKELVKEVNALQK